MIALFPDSDASDCLVQPALPTAALLRVHMKPFVVKILFFLLFCRVTSPLIGCEVVQSLVFSRSDGNGSIDLV